MRPAVNVRGISRLLIREASSYIRRHNDRKLDRAENFGSLYYACKVNDGHCFVSACHYQLMLSRSLQFKEDLNCEDKENCGFVILNWLPINIQDYGQKCPVITCAYVI